MVVTAFLAFAATAAPQAQPASPRTGTAAIGVGAIVIRPAPQPVLAVRRGAVTISNAGSAIVSAEGGTARRLDGGTILVTPGAAGAMTITITY